MKSFALILLLTFISSLIWAKTDENFQFQSNHLGELVSGELTSNDGNTFSFTIDNDLVFKDIKQEISTDKSVIFWYLSRFNILGPSFTKSAEEYSQVAQYRVWKTKLPTSGIPDGLYVFYDNNMKVKKSVYSIDGSIEVLSLLSKQNCKTITGK